MAVFVRAWASTPDDSTVDAFKRAPIDAKPITHIDLVRGAPSDIYLARLFGRLGIAAAFATKAKRLAKRCRKKSSTSLLSTGIAWATNRQAAVLGRGFHLRGELLYEH